MKAYVIPIAFLLAIISVCLTYYFSAALFMALPVFAAVICLVFKLVFKRKISVVIVCFVWITAIMFMTAARLDYADSVLYRYMNSECVIYGKVIAEVSDEENFAVYTLNVDKVADTKLETKEKVEVTVEKYNGFKNLNYGDYVCAKVTLQPADGDVNVGRIDYGLIKKIDSIYFDASVIGRNIRVLHELEAPQDLEDICHIARKYVFDAVNKYMPSDTGAFVISILVSEKKFLESRTKENLEIAGLVHLSAASGLHVNCIIAVITFALGLVRLRRRTAMLAAVPLIIVYIFINGCSPSILRASFMVFPFILSQFIRRDSDTFINLCLSGVVILLINPLSVFDIGFVLSFSSVTAIILFADDIMKLMKKIPQIKVRSNEFLKRTVRKTEHYIKATVSVCLAVQTVTVPLCAYYFGYAAVYSIITNLLVSWILPFLMMSAVLMLVFSGIEFIGGIFAFLTGVIARGILLTADLVSSVPGAKAEIYVTLGEVVTLIALLLAVRSFVRKEKKRTFLLGGICLVLMICGLWQFLSDLGSAEVSFVNVGQADGCVIKLNGGKGIVIDGGGNPLSKEDRVFVPYMKRSGIKEVEYIFVSHFDADHAKNVLGVMDEFEVENIVLPIRGYRTEYKMQIEQKAAKNGINIIYSKSGDKFEIGKNIKVDIYAPSVYTASLEENNASMVMKMQIADTEILFLGDMENQTQELMAENYKDKLDCDILKIAHHGAADGYCTRLVEYASPEYAVISCGSENIYKHPDDKVVSDLMRRKIATFITAKDNNIIFNIRRNGMKIECSEV